MTVYPVRRIRQRDRILAYVCAFAQENSGVTPSIRVIARNMGMGRTTVAVHLELLRQENRIEWIEGRMKVIDSTWDPPPDIEL